MSNQNKQPSEKSWGQQPVTYRELIVFFSLSVIVVITFAGLLVWKYIIQVDTPLVEATQSEPESNGQPAAQGSRGSGQGIFEDSCIACHTIGGGPGLGPDLEEVTDRQTREWLLEWIQRPDEVLAGGDQYATELFQEYNLAMPNPGLSETQARDVLAYLENPGGETSQEIVLPEGGEPEKGKAIFTGSVRLTNGGPPCMSCHNTTGVGELGGGTLGPDLTNVYSRYEEGLSSALDGLPFPTMQGVFADKPLTEDEVADLYAYFEQIDQKASEQISYDFVWLGLGGFLVFSLLGHLKWRKRLTGVRKPLLGGSK
ncbi:MAG: cytochrome c [Chloroflexi bacterium]|nr:cytochrome c [Chloroflexota bacterium]